MTLSIVNVVDNLDKINAGIWGAAVFGSGFLREHGITSYLFVCRGQHVDDKKPNDVQVEYLDESTEQIFFTKLETLGASADRTIIVTHGCWRPPTRLGHTASARGFKWVFLPQGMLEPWSMNQKKFKKMIYFFLFEKPWTSKADVIRSVSRNEFDNLNKTYRRKIVKIENGVPIPEYKEKSGGRRVYLFMARLHHKKGVVPLVQAWHNVMSKNQEVELIIAGPDEGELQKILPLLTGNARYVGPQYGDDKTKLLRSAHYYLLPSFSEGFPSSVVEAMSFGLIPIISRGCNFQAVYEERLGYEIGTEPASIVKVLQVLKDMSFDNGLSLANHQYVKAHNSEEQIGSQLLNVYQNLLPAMTDIH